MTVKGWLRALTGLTAAAVAFVGLLTWHVAAIVLGVGVLAVLALDDGPRYEIRDPPPVPRVGGRFVKLLDGREVWLPMDLREARRQGRA